MLGSARRHLRAIVDAMETQSIGYFNTLAQLKEIQQDLDETDHMIQILSENLEPSPESLANIRAATASMKARRS